MSLTKFIKYLNSEENLIRTIFVSILSSFVVFGIIYFTKLKYIENFIPKYGIFLFFAILSYALILSSVRHIRIYKNFPCMSGMMIGMTIGMFSGFLPGFYIGATNGMFYGSIFGMAIGILFGAWNGKCCGIMGIMEGIMAGFMGGLMGAMTALMMFNENLKAMSVIIFAVSGIILIGLNYLIYKETREIEIKNKEDESFTILWSILLALFTIWFMAFGPRSILFS